LIAAMAAEPDGAQPTPPPDQAPHRVVVVGGGFGGVQAVKGLADAPVSITLIDRRNFTLFQPLTYQIATGALSPGDIAYPLRALFRRQRNVETVVGEVTTFELDARRLHIRYPVGEVGPETVEYDTLIVAAGSSYSYFGHDEFSRYAHEVKTLESAVTVRSQILRAFERAESGSDERDREADLTFVVVGAGPTGVEMAGQIGELARRTLKSDFRRIDTRAARVLLLDGEDRILRTFPPSLSTKAVAQLERLGVTVQVNQMVVDVDDRRVVVQDKEGNRSEIETHTVVWAAGVNASGLAGQLASGAGGDVDKSGRLTVEADLTLPGHPEVIVLGDMVRVRDRKGEAKELPGVAPVAIQMGRYAGKLVTRRLAGRPHRPFHYRDKGNLATIGRGSAVADLHLIRLSGPLAWLVWLVVHLFYLIGFRNRFLVFAQWSFSYFSGGRGSCLIEDQITYSPGPTARMRSENSSDAG
jgi:NADH:ubiquinone reductase (H+-translocating)